jgi:hypothetical protein
MATPNETAAELMYEMKRRTEKHPLFGVNDRHELLTFFQGEYRELERLVRRFRVRRTENSYNSYPSFMAAKRECNNGVCRRDPLPKAQNVTPAAVAHAPEKLG